MKKIAVCIPTYNEGHIIRKTLKKIDKGLIKYKNNGYDVVIINYDNGSPDNTSKIFKNTNTECPKISMITKKKGKGINLLEFFKYCKINEIDYAITLDADVKSMKSNWINKFLEPLILHSGDYVTPIYMRSRYEGSTTNHFAFPAIYAATGHIIRQPIAGDFSFNNKFINTVLKYPTCEATEKYGIDIFMSLIACHNNLNIIQIQLDKKIHNPSYDKMENMFKEILDSFLFTWGKLKKTEKNISDEFSCNYNCILRSRKFSHKIAAEEMLEKYLIEKKFANIDIESLWIDKLANLIVSPELITEDEKKEIKEVFIIRAIQFWIKSEKTSAKDCESIIDNQVQKLLYKIKEVKNEKFNY